MDKCKIYLPRLYYDIMIFIALIYRLDWFQAGKGPDPDVKALDQDLDAYKAAKPAK